MSLIGCSFLFIIVSPDYLVLFGSPKCGASTLKALRRHLPGTFGALGEVVESIVFTTKTIIAYL
jgi:hypothetical protein